VAARGFDIKKVRIAVRANMEGANQRVAYLKAYPGQKKNKIATLDPNVSKLFASPAAKEYKAELEKEHRKRHAKTIDDVVDRLSMMGFADIRTLFDESGTLLPPSQWPDDITTVVGGLDTVTIGNTDVGIGEVKKIKLDNRLQPLIKLGEHLGMWEKKLAITGEGGGPVEVKDVTDNEVARRLAFLLRQGSKP